MHAAAAALSSKHVVTLFSWTALLFNKLTNTDTVFVKPTNIYTNIETVYDKCTLLLPH